jgi:DNA-binding transcriptional MerR regulator
MAGLSVRSLHHYDAIGLLKPGAYSASGYRLYGEAELLRLQQILFYRELDFPLEEIGALLDRPDFDAVTALREHRLRLGERAARLGRLIETIDKSLERLEGQGMLSDEELYEGFSKKAIEEMKGEAEARWGGSETYRQSQKRVAAMDRAGFEAVKAEGEALDRELAAACLAGLDPLAPAVQALIARKYEHLRHFYEPSPEIFAGLGAMYAEDRRFSERYEGLAPGLAPFLRAAMEGFAKRPLTAKGRGV